jgi:hypothetical protein
MKFHDIAIGQRFEFDGAVYVKTSPMLASPQEGSASRFIARYAQVNLLDGAGAPANLAEARVLRADEVVAAFDLFYSCCTRELAGCELAADRLENLRAAIDAGRDDFLATLTRLDRAKPS